MGNGHLAGLFKGHVPKGYRKKTKKILYIGKATAGPFEGSDPSEQSFNRSTAGFWSFARSISRCADDKCDDLSNLVWSNLCKIGVSNGNPANDLAEQQRELAVETLRREIKFLKPSLVVCVAEGYQDHFLYQVLEVEQGVNDGFRCRLSGKLFLYFRAADGGWPPILWMRHPQFKNHTYLADALGIARDLMEGRPMLDREGT